MDVIDFEQRRRERQDPQPEYASCVCGEAWFELRGGPTGNGAVCMSRDGAITGYVGTPCCVACGKPVTLRS